MLPFPVPFWKPEGLFLWYSLWGFARAPRGKTLKSVGHFDDWVPLEFLSQSCLHWTFSSSSLRPQVSLPRHCFPWKSLLSALGFLLQEVGFSVFVHLFLQLWGQRLPCDFTAFMDLRRVDFCLFSFLLVSTDWGLPSLLQAGLETESPS